MSEYTQQKQAEIMRNTITVTTSIPVKPNKAEPRKSKNAYFEFLSNCIKLIKSFLKERIISAVIIGAATTACLFFVITLMWKESNDIGYIFLQTSIFVFAFAFSQIVIFLIVTATEFIRKTKHINPYHTSKKAVRRKTTKCKRRYF
ncbi:MAG: hypothetical protein RR497_04890 [Oscillospiraceae bacterium]